ncbi:MAG: LptF/LptG family permease [Candidatus Methylomirabilales bacterium]
MVRRATRRERNYHPPIVEFHKKLAIPLSCALFTVAGVPLAIRIKRGGRGISLAISMAFALSYNVLIAAGGLFLLFRAELYPATPLQGWRTARTSGLGASSGG